ncbi:MAG: DNA primase [Candidatus Sulfobium sp.]
MKTSTLLEDIKSRLDIVDLISGYVQLKKAGQNWKGLCPFHSEKTPSFMVSQSKQIFHCFGCGAGGDIIAFVKAYENISFPEAVSLLAGKAGIALPATGISDRNSRKEEKIRNAMREAGAFFARQLSHSASTLDYLKQRGISHESVESFMLGYAPPGSNSLLKYLGKKGYDDEVIRDAGLAAQGNRGLYDMFRQRLMFPITGVSGGVLAFGGRALAGVNPKYINSPETAVFKKSDTLYGLSSAREEIRRQNRVMIVEGYLDVIVCHQHGFKNAVAPLGTSLTEGQTRKLRNMTDSAVLVFDGDTAGIAAAKRALPVICRHNFTAGVLVLPGGEDPDSYIRKYGGQSFQELLDNAGTLVDFLLGVSRSGRTDTVREILMLVSEVKDLLLADEMLIELADRTRMNEGTIREEFRKIRTKPAGNVQVQRVEPGVLNKEEYILLSAVIAFPEKSGHVFSELDIEDLRDATVRSLCRKITSLPEDKDISSILDTADEAERRILTKLSVDPGFDPEDVDRNIEDCIRTVRKRKLDEKILSARMSGEFRLLNQLIAERINL